MSNPHGPHPENSVKEIVTSGHSYSESACEHPVEATIVVTMGSEPTEHPTSAELLAFRQGRRTTNDVEALAVHLEGCTVCFQQFVAMPESPLEKLVRAAIMGVSVSDQTPLPKERLRLQLPPIRPTSD
ncbi:MAG: hypothetical protein ACRCZF_20440 [Gemmataceae bacterium]